MAVLVAVYIPRVHALIVAVPVVAPALLVGVSVVCVVTVLAQDLADKARLGSAESAGLVGCVGLGVFHLQLTCLESYDLVVVPLFTKTFL